jgi:hypothetical protein
MHTGYVTRPGEGTPGPQDQSDVYATDLADLAAQLTRGRGPVR